MRTQNVIHEQRQALVPRRWSPLAVLLVASFAALWPVTSHGQPPLVDRHASIYEPDRDRTLVFGGYDGVKPRRDIWALTLVGGPRWAPVTPLGDPIRARFGHSAIHDVTRNRMVVFGGIDSSGAALDETLALSLENDPTWAILPPSGPRPRARPYHSAVYDSRRDRMWIFGGGLLSFFNDVWSLSLGDTARWDSLRVRAGAIPTARHSHAAIYDARRDRMIVFGGLFASNDVWQLTFADTTWSRIPDVGAAPRARSGHSAIYDPVGDRMIVFGGQDGNGQRLNDVWALQLSEPVTWSPLVTRGGPPSTRAYHTAVYDSLRRAMVVYGGGFPYAEDATWVLSLGSTPTWSPPEPVLELSADHLEFPVVTIGDTVAVPLSIANFGLTALDITAIHRPSEEFRLTSTAPFALPWEAEVAEMLTLVASNPRTQVDSLVIESSDPRIPRKTVSLEIDVRGLDFSSRVLDSPSEVPLGVSFVVVATPAPRVRVEQGFLFYRILGSSAAFDSVALNPLATDFIASVPAESVTESGVEYYLRVENSGFRSTQPPGAPSAAVFTQAVIPASSMTVAARPSSGRDFLAGRDIELEVVLPDGAGFVSGRVHYRMGGETSYQTDTVTTGGALGRPVATIPRSVVGSRGVEYWVEVQTLASDLRFPALAPEPAIIPIKVQDLIEPAVHSGGRYRLLSVPLDFGEDFSGSLDAILTDQLGTYDPTQWRAYRYDPDSSRNLEFSPDRGASFGPKPGRAFWLVSRAAHRVDTAPIEGFSTRTGAPYPIVLAPGWNSIGNPFDFPVAWTDVTRNAAVIDDPVAFDPNLGTVGDYVEDPPTVLIPFEGYFVENISTTAETLWVQPRTAPEIEPLTLADRFDGGLRGGGAETSEAVTAAWSFRLEARTDRATDRSNLFGIDAKAADEFDSLDLRETPSPPGPWVQIAFAHPDWNTRPGLYRRDVRSDGADGHVWEVEVRTAETGERVTLDLVPTTSLPSDLVVTILDREQDTHVEATRVSEVRYELLARGPARSYRLAIIAGTRDYVSQTLDPSRHVPARLTLDSAAPNPFRAATRIRFGLPRPTAVHIDIYSVRGERVATLVDRARLEPGFHSLLWDGRTSNGSPAPSGVYWVRVMAGDERLSGRIIRVR